MLFEPPGSECNFRYFRRRYFESGKMATMRAQIAIAGASISFSSDLGSIAMALAEFDPAVAVLVLHESDPEIGAKILENMEPPARVDVILGSIDIDFLRTEAILTAIRTLGSKRADPFFKARKNFSRHSRPGKLKCHVHQTKLFVYRSCACPRPMR